MNRYRTSLMGVLSALILAATLAACGEDAADDADTQPAEDAQGETQDTGGVTVSTTEDDLGTYLTDGQGRTLYLFTQDSPGTSTCEGECLDAWPVLEGEATAGEGAQADLLGTLERSDGTVQATYNEWPLYYFADDAGAGDTAGQGVNDVWWVIDPEGEAIEQMPADDDNSGGYGG